MKGKLTKDDLYLQRSEELRLPVVEHIKVNEDFFRFLHHDFKTEQKKSKTVNKELNTTISFLEEVIDTFKKST